MPSMTLNDPNYVAPQYQDTSHVDVRINFHRRFSTNKYGWHPWVFDHLLNLPTHCRLLELGCGPGNLWTENIPRIPPGWEITLSDFSAGMLEGARRKLEALRPFQFKVIDAQSIPYEAGAFDAVIANHMLFHVADLSATLQEIRRVLRQQGRLFAATNGRQHFLELANLMVKFDPELAFWSAANSPFRLEDGETDLSPWFTDIQRYMFDNSLEVNEVTALVDYILSGRKTSLVGMKLDQFKEFLTREMEACGGCFHITTSGGMFVCIRKEVE